MRKQHALTTQQQQREEGDSHSNPNKATRLTPIYNAGLAAAAKFTRTYGLFMAL